MSDDLAECAVRVLERLGVPDPWKTSTLQYFEAGRERYGPYHHLAMSDEEVRAEVVCEASDLLAFLVLFPWSRAYHSTLADGEAIGSAEEDADTAIDLPLVEAYVDFLTMLNGAADETPTHLTEGESGGSHARTGDVRHRNDDARARRGGFAAEGR